MISPREFKTLRLSKGLTQKELAEIVGTTQTTITNIEKGITKSPSFDIALKIADALGESVYNIFGTSSNASKNSISFVKLPPNKEKESKFSILCLYTQEVMATSSLLLDLSLNERLSEEERYNYRMQKENLQDGLVRTFNIFKDKGILDNEDIQKLIDAFPNLMWQNFLSPLRELLTEK